MIKPLGTGSSELVAMVKSLGIEYGFLGVFDKNFPGFLNVDRMGMAIVNTGDISSGGVHWIAFGFDPITLKFYMFDPFGWSKKELLHKYQFQYDRMVRNTAVKTRKCITLVKSEEAVQCPCSAACGLFCLLFLYSFYYFRFSPMKNNPVIDIVVGVPHKYLFTFYGILVTHLNQENLYNWLKEKCMYFREKEKYIKENTKLFAIKIH
ncbi:protease [Psittacine adenovirus 2]|uniref:Protease n=1 Tax=Psittacine adenovirus 2 TaxID=1301246 RepID=A0ABX8SRR6_9ADEN|nr:adenovirus endopeptidase [Psittacine adenovirus 2]QZW33252.1 ORF13 protease [Psittacine siadenovirus F]QXX30957.1 protease [Psittacine adenovirus 2]QZW33696.1 ORF13 protease [Psittacine adenovirus 2]WGL41021.1 protease [Psittacine siadenovirus F]